MHCPTLSELIVQSVLSYDWHECIAIFYTLTKLSMREFVSVLQTTQILSSWPCSKFVSCASPPNGGPAASQYRKAQKLRLEMSFPDVHAMDSCGISFSPRLKSLKAHHDLLLKFYQAQNFLDLSARPTQTAPLPYGKWAYSVNGPSSLGHITLSSRTRPPSHMYEWTCPVSMRSFREFMAWTTSLALLRPPRLTTSVHPRVTSRRWSWRPFLLREPIHLKVSERHFKRDIAKAGARQRV